ncbi:hypothetical protein DID75_05730 [Candidatus Marinamargulisbacteria bacterium SCGC AG-410-N11]|nr:hypothetical protein DID75_05730 [Candidatus Marinamargulisbacteria bacterium SCGC AG-410-N11]
MIKNSIHIFFLTSFRDYKAFWLKTILSILGLILSIGLVTSVFIFVDTIEKNLNKQDLLSKVYPSNYITHNRGGLKNSEIRDILKLPMISHGYPFTKITQEIQINNKNYISHILGIDSVFLNSVIQDQLQLSNESFNNADLFLLTNKIDSNKRVSITLNKKKLKALQIYSSDFSIPTLVMDISDFKRVYPNILIDRFYLEDYQAKEFTSISFTDIILSKQTAQSSRLSDSFFINLKFIGIFSIVISSLLIYLFFRFIQKQRLLIDQVLLNLGISNISRRLVMAIEIVGFIIITTIIGVSIGIGMSQLGIGVLSKTINTLYYSISIDNIIISFNTIIKALLISTVSVTLAISPIIQTVEKKLLHCHRYFQWLIAVTFIIVSYWYLLTSNHIKWVAFQSMISLLLLIFFCTLIIISLLSYFFKNQSIKSFIMLKTASFYIRRDIILSTIMVVAISLACGLFISMTIFINSFELSVKSWIVNSTPMDIYIQAKNNSIPNPVALSDDDINNIINHPGIIEARSISRDRIKINGNPMILTAVPFKDLFKEIQVILHNNKPTSSNDIFISEAALNKLKVSVGSKLTIPTRMGDITGEVAGVYTDYASELGVITISKKKMKSLYKKNFQLHGLALNINPKFKETLFDSFSHLLIQTNKQLQSYVINTFNQTFALTWVLASISGIIALFVLINMLSVLTIDRRVELTQLFTMGGQKKHIIQLIFSHSCFIGVISVLMSIVTGLGLSWVILKKITPIHFGWNIPLTFSFKPIIWLSILMVLIIIVTSYIAFKHVWKNISSEKRVYESIKSSYFIN